MDSALEKNPNKIVIKDDQIEDPNNNNQEIDENNDDVKPKDKVDKSDPEGNDKNEDNDKTEEVEYVEIDGKQYVLDKDGNALENNNIVYTKEQLDGMSEDNDDNNNQEPSVTVKDISDRSGIVITDNNGNAIDYDMSVEGLAKREIDIYNKGVKDAESQAVNNFLKANPDILDVVNYKLTYGTIEGYTSGFDYSKVQLDKNNKNQLKDIIIKSEVAKGNSVERATRIANLIEADNTLETEAEEALNYLKNQQQQKAEANIRAAQEEQLRAIEEQNKFYGVGVDAKGNVVDLNIEGSIYDIVVKKGDIQGLHIPEAGVKIKTSKGDRIVSRQELYNYIANPVKQIDGYWYTQAQLDDMARMNNPEYMVFNYIRNLMEDDISQLIKKEINKDKVLTIRRLSSKNNKSAGTKRRTNGGLGEDKIVLPIK